MERNCKKHKIPSKMAQLLKRRDKIVNKDNSTPKKTDLKCCTDKWHEEHVQFETGAEKRCRKKKMGKISYSCEVGEWIIKKRNVLRWLKNITSQDSRDYSARSRRRVLKRRAVPLIYHHQEDAPGPPHM